MKRSYKITLSDINNILIYLEDREEFEQEEASNVFLRLYFSSISIICAIYFVISKAIKNPELRGYIINSIITIFLNNFNSETKTEAGLEYLLNDKMEQITQFCEVLSEDTLIFSNEEMNESMIVSKKTRYSVLYRKSGLKRVIFQTGVVGWIK